MRTSTLILLVLILGFSNSCGNRKKKKMEKNQVENLNLHKTDNGTIVNVSLVDITEKIPSDPFTLIDVHIDDMNMMHLTVEYSGGCEPHEFQIIGSKSILKSMPPQRPIMIVHKANGDACRQIVREQILVNISDFAYTKETGSEIILLLDGQRISYIYQAEEATDK
jgi:hypothetical protein